MVTPFDLEKLRNMVEPAIALILTVDEGGRVLDTQIVDVAEAMMVLRSNPDVQETESPPEAKEQGQWWSPVEKGNPE
jgi:hypothetical protein